MWLAFNLFVEQIKLLSFPSIPQIHISIIRSCIINLEDYEKMRSKRTSPSRQYLRYLLYMHIHIPNIRDPQLKNYIAFISTSFKGFGNNLLWSKLYVHGLARLNLITFAKHALPPNHFPKPCLHTWCLQSLLQNFAIKFMIVSTTSIEYSGKILRYPLKNKWNFPSNVQYIFQSVLKYAAEDSHLPYIEKIKCLFKKRS